MRNSSFYWDRLWYGIHGPDPLINGWHNLNRISYIYNNYYYDVTFKITKIFNQLLTLNWKFSFENKTNFKTKKQDII